MLSEYSTSKIGMFSVSATVPFQGYFGPRQSPNAPCSFRLLTLSSKWISMPCMSSTLTMNMMKNMRQSAQKSDTMEPIIETIILRTPWRNFTTRSTFITFARRMRRMNFSILETRMTRSTLAFREAISICMMVTARMTRSKRFQPISCLKRPPDVHTLIPNSRTIQTSTIHSPTTKPVSFRGPGGGPVPSAHIDMPSTWPILMLVSAPTRSTLIRTAEAQMTLKAELSPILLRQSSFFQSSSSLVCFVLATFFLARWTPIVVVISMMSSPSPDFLYLLLNFSGASSPSPPLSPWPRFSSSTSSPMSAARPPLNMPMPSEARSIRPRLKPPPSLNAAAFSSSRSRKPEGFRPPSPSSPPSSVWMHTSWVIFPS
mmetsp:Transcript_16751/g.50289  ORF Transcript_16751/g.50289 Transcript_16751/m.50289 type:complete len:372 (+) Transcript_16751:857-1972(+)